MGHNSVWLLNFEEEEIQTQTCRDIWRHRDKSAIQRPKTETYKSAFLHWLRRNQPRRYLDLGLPKSRTEENQFLLIKTRSICFVMAATGSSCNSPPWKRAWRISYRSLEGTPAALLAPQSHLFISGRKAFCQQFRNTENSTRNTQYLIQRVWANVPPHLKTLIQSDVHFSLVYNLNPHFWIDIFDNPIQRKEETWAKAS